MLDYDDVIAILKVYEYQSFSKAAESLYIGQPALSKKIREIEKKLGYPIFDRGRGQTAVEISEQGMALLPILNRIKQLNQDAQDLRYAGRQFRIRIASSDGPYLAVLDTTVEKLIGRNSHIIYRLKGLSYQECIDAVANDTVDLAFVGSHFYREHVSVLPLYEEHMVFISTDRNRDDREVDPSRLDLATAIYSPYSAAYSFWFRSTFRNQRPMIQCDLITQVKRYMRSLGFWSIVPFSVARYIAMDMDITILPIKNAPPNRLIYYAAKMATMKPESLEFMDTLRTTLKEENYFKIYQ